MASEVGHHQRPPPLNPECNPAAWRRWRKIVEAHAIVTKLSRKREQERQATIVTIIGMAALDLYESLPFAAEDEKYDLTTTLDYLEDHFVGRANVSYERFVFNTRKQQAGETFVQYLAALRQQANLCDFSSITPDQILRDRLVCGVRDESLRQALLSKSTLTLEQCIQMCRVREQSATQTATIRSTTTSGEQTADTGSVFSAKPTGNISQHGRNGRNGGNSYRRWNSTCQYCGRDHQRGARHCQAWGQQCGKCGGRNHFASVCRSTTGME